MFLIEQAKIRIFKEKQHDLQIRTSDGSYQLKNSYELPEFLGISFSQRRRGGKTVNSKYIFHHLDLCLVPPQSPLLPKINISLCFPHLGGNVGVWLVGWMTKGVSRRACPVPKVGRCPGLHGVGW